MRDWAYSTLLGRSSLSKQVRCPVCYPSLHGQGNGCQVQAEILCRSLIGCRSVLQPGENSLRCVEEVGPVFSRYAKPGGEQHGVSVMLDPELLLGFCEVRLLLLDLRGKVWKHLYLAVPEGDIDFHSCEMEDGVPISEIQEFCDKGVGRCTLRRGLTTRQ